MKSSCHCFVSHAEETSLTRPYCQQESVVKIPVLFLEITEFRRVCHVDGDEFAMAFEVNRSVMGDPHKVNLILPSKTAINEQALPIEARCGVILQYVIAFLRMSVRMEEIDPNKKVFIVTKDTSA
jgi:hypothetical protein